MCVSVEFRTSNNTVSFGSTHVVASSVKCVTNCVNIFPFSVSSDFEEKKIDPNVVVGKTGEHRAG